MTGTLAACSIRSTIVSGWVTIARCPEAISTVVAPMRSSKLPLGVRRNRLVVRGDDKPRRQRLPRRLAHRVVEGTHRDGLLDRVENPGLSGIQIAGEMVDEIVLGKPAESLLVDG